MKIVVRTYRSRTTGKVTRREWWLVESGFPVATGPARTRREAKCRGRAAADQLNALARDMFSGDFQTYTITRDPLT